MECMRYILTHSMGNSAEISKKKVCVFEDAFAFSIDSCLKQHKAK